MLAGESKPCPQRALNLWKTIFSQNKTHVRSSAAAAKMACNAFECNAFEPNPFRLRKHSRSDAWFSWIFDDLEISVSKRVFQAKRAGQKDAKTAGWGIRRSSFSWTQDCVHLTSWTFLLLVSWFLVAKMCFAIVACIANIRSIWNGQ